MCAPVRAYTRAHSYSVSVLAQCTHAHTVTAWCACPTRLQETAGLFAHLKETEASKVDNPRPVDLSPECLSMMEKLMLAQAQVAKHTAGSAHTSSGSLWFVLELHGACRIVLGCVCTLLCTCIATYIVASSTANSRASSRDKRALRLWMEAVSCR